METHAPSSRSTRGSTVSSLSLTVSSELSSARSATNAREQLNLNKDTSLSPVDLEALIQTERVTKILDECIYKTKLAICLPNLVKEFHTLSSILSSQNMDDLIYIFDQYDKPLMSSSFWNMDALEEIKSGAITLQNRINPELGHLIYIMSSYPALKPKVEEMVEKMKLEYQDNEKPPSLNYLSTLERFRDLMVEQLSTSASEELAAKFKARKLESQNEKLIAKIKECSKALAQEKADYEAMLETKMEKARELEAELAALQTDTTERIKQKILDSERQMVLASRVHSVKNDMLQDEQAETTRVYNTTLETNVKNEKKLRLRRLRVETQLLSWINKYDVEMADKQVELDDFQQKYEDEVRACEELEEKIRIQNIDYIPLMAEREEEYHREMKEKMEKFLREHAARVIQSAWRTVLANRAERKKLYKIQKQQRIQAAQAEAAAEKLRKHRLQKKHKIINKSTKQ